MSTKVLVVLAVLFVVSVLVAYHVAAWQMRPHRVSIQRGPDVPAPNDKPGPSIPVEPGNHEIPCDPSRGKCWT